jgi:hypothetical protein
LTLAHSIRACILKAVGSCRQGKSWLLSIQYCVLIEQVGELVDFTAVGGRIEADAVERPKNRAFRNLW